MLIYLPDHVFCTAVRCKRVCGSLGDFISGGVRLKELNLSGGSHDKVCDELEQNERHKPDP